MNGQVSPLYKFIRSDITVKRLAQILGVSLSGAYKYVEGVRTMDIYKFKKLVKELQDKDLIDWFLEGTDYVAVKISGKKLNGKWEDEIKQIVITLGEMVKKLEKNDYINAKKEISKMHDLLQTLKKEIEMKEEERNA